MKLFLLLFSLLPHFEAHASCVEVIPFRSIGALRLGQIPPETSLAGHKIKKEASGDQNWFTSGPYRFRLGPDQRIDLIQFTPPNEKTCYSLRGKRLKTFTDIPSLAREFPTCELVRAFPADRLECDGISFLHADPLKLSSAPLLRIDIENRSLHGRQAERAGWATKAVLRREWPFRGGPPAFQPPKWKPQPSPKPIVD